MQADPAGPRLAVRLLGGFELHTGDTPLPRPESARVESLLAYLLLHRDAPQDRARIAAALWPDSTEAQARTNLRHLLHKLRRALTTPEHYLAVTDRTLHWHPRVPWSLDVAAFDDAVRRAGPPAAGDDAVAALAEAVAGYRGDLLPGCYDEWLDAERRQLRDRFLAALSRLAELLESRGRPDEAVRHAERWLREDPLAEGAYRLLMRLHDARGDRTRALRVYHACAATLERELGAAPSAATRRQYERLMAADRARSAPAPVARSTAVPFVGRARERARLVGDWHAATAGAARLALVTGEAGIGKTRLLEEFRAWCGQRGAVTAAAAAYPAEGSLAYGLVVSWLRDDALAGRWRALPAGQLTELARLLPEVLTELPDLPRPRALPEDELRRRLFDALAGAILVPGPAVLLVADDLHFCDRESLRFLHYLLRVCSPARLLVAAGARTDDPTGPDPLAELVAALRTAGRVTELALDRLDPDQTAALAERAGGGGLDGAARERLHQETGGNPLFVVEALRAGWPGAGATVTPRVQAVIGSRLAQLSPPARELVDVAATVGRHFTVDLLVRAGDADEDTVVGALDELWRRRIVREHGTRAYDFGHDQLRAVAYAALGPARRRRLHLRVARALQQDPGPEPVVTDGQLAVHLERAGEATAALDRYARAARAAQALYAHTEARRLIEHALDLLGTLPADERRDGRELDLLTDLVAPLAAVDGYASARLAAAQERALDLARSLGREPGAPLLRGLAVASLSRGDVARAVDLGSRLRERGVRDGDDVLTVEAAYVLGIAAFWQGRFPAAAGHFTAAVDRYRPADSPTHLARYGLDPRVVCLSRLANTRWFLGEHGGALRARDAALAAAGEIGHPLTRRTALVFAALLALDMRDDDALRRHTAALRAGDGAPFAASELATEALAGYVDVLDGKASAGLARIRAHLVDGPDPAPGTQAIILRVLLAACAVAGDARAGLAAADRALAEGHGVRTWWAEAHRLRAGFLAAEGAPVAQVTATLDVALATATEQGAHLFALRAATDAARAAGRGADPDRLGALLARCDAAHETPDWRDAAAVRGAAPPAHRSGERSGNAASASL